MQTTNALSRRQFLAATLLAVLALARRSEGASCTLTEDNPAGPFYIPGAPFFTDRLAPEKLPGERLRIAGRVLGGPACTPLAGAVLDIWHANAKGFYSGLEASRPLKPEEYRLRGRIRTDAQGRYAFDTILPGNYRVDEDWVRPRHIHFIISHPGHASLTTQLYFEGDPANQTDALVKRSLIIPLKRSQGAGGAVSHEGTFDIVLAAG